MITKLEIYCVVGLMIVFGNAGFYALGRWHGEKQVYLEQAKADQAETRKILDRAIDIRNSDDQGRSITNEFIHRVTQGLSDVNTKFAKLPNVVVDSRGCSDFSPAFSLRYNAVSDLLSGHAIDPAGDIAHGVPADGLPPSR